MDYDHNQAEVRVDELSPTDRGRTAIVTFSNDDNEFEQYSMRRFALSQLLKFASMRKADLKDENGEVLPDAGETVLEELEEDSLVFKFDKQARDVIGVVSPNYVSIPSEEVDDLVQQTIGRMGIALDETTKTTHRTGIVCEWEYRFTDESREVENVGDQLDAGIRLRNSVFGASSLRVNRFYTILACSNGMLSRQSQSSFRKVHMGDPEELREMLVEEVETQVENIWEDTDLIENVHSIEFPLEDQIDFLEALAENRRITKKAAGSMAAHILTEGGEDLEDWRDEIEQFKLAQEVSEETWNTGDENVWGLLNAFTGYTTHSDISSHSTIQDIERVYNQVLTSDDKQELLAVAE